MQWSEATNAHARALKTQGERVEPVQLLKARKELERILVRVIILAGRQSRGAVVVRLVHALQVVDAPAKHGDAHAQRAREVDLI